MKQTLWMQRGGEVNGNNAKCKNKRKSRCRRSG